MMGSWKTITQMTMEEGRERKKENERKIKIIIMIEKKKLYKHIANKIKSFNLIQGYLDRSCFF